MSQATVVLADIGPHNMHDFVDGYINPALLALLSSSSGSTPPGNGPSGVPVKGQFWLDTSLSPNVLRMFTGSVWGAIGTLDLASGVFTPAGQVALTGRVTTLEATQATLEATETSHTTALAELTENSPTLSIRPAAFPLAFTNALVGSPSVVPPLSGGTFVDMALGGAYRVVGAAVIALAVPLWLEPSRRYALRVISRRLSNPNDPAGDTMRVGLQWLDRDYAAISTLTLKDTVQTVAMGTQVVAVRIPSLSGDAITVTPPAGAVYARPYIQTFGADGVTDAVAFVIDDVTDLSGYSPDLTSITGRVSALESEVADLDPLAAGSANGYATLDAYANPAQSLPFTLGITHAQIASSHIPAAVVRFHTVDGAPYIRGNDATARAIQDANGQWWQIDCSGVVDVTWFGAIGGESAGNAADAAAFIAAFNSPAKAIKAGPGVWDARGAELPGNKSFRGAGKDITFLTPSSACTFVIKINSACTAEGFTVNGNTHAQQGVAMTGAYFVIRSVHANHCTYGFYNYGGDQFYWENTSTDSNTHGIHSDYGFNTCWIQGHNSRAFDQYGAYFTYPDVIQTCTFPAGAARTVFTTPWTPHAPTVAADLKVIVGGVTKTYGSDYTVSAPSPGPFYSAPAVVTLAVAAAPDTVVIDDPANPGWDQTQAVYMTDCMFYLNSLGAVKFEKNTLGFTFSHSVVDGCSGTGIDMGPGHGAGGDILILESFVGATGPASIDIGPDNNHIKVSGCAIGNAAYGVRVQATPTTRCSGVTIEDCQFGNQSSNPIILDSVLGGVVEKSYFALFGGSPDIAVLTTYTAGPLYTTVVRDNTFTKANPVTTLLTDCYNNKGYTTKGFGRAALLAGNTSVVIPHKLNGTPSWVQVTPMGNVGKFYVDEASINATNFTFHCETAPASNVTVAFEASFDGGVS